MGVADISTADCVVNELGSSDEVGNSISDDLGTNAADEAVGCASIMGGMASVSFDVKILVTSCHVSRLP